MSVYDNAKKIATGTYTDALLCDDGVTLLKVVRDPKDEPRLKKEVEIVSKLKKTNLADLFPDILDETAGLKVCDSCPERFKCFTSAKNFNCSMKNNAVAYRYDKDMPSLEKVLKVYPNGIDERDMVWMYKRLLAAIWTAHSLGYIHSAVLPEHVLLNLKTHGIWLIDWMHVNQVGKKPKFEVHIKDYYPEYALTVENGTALDIHMATILMTKLMGGIDNVSKDIRIIMRAGSMGMTDARELHEQLDKVVKKLYGSVFRPFKV
jgi:hypothetical protein